MALDRPDDVQSPQCSGMRVHWHWWLQSYLPISTRQQSSVSGPSWYLSAQTRRSTYSKELLRFVLSTSMLALIVVQSHAQAPRTNIIWLAIIAQQSSAQSRWFSLWAPWWDAFALIALSGITSLRYNATLAREDTCDNALPWTCHSHSSSLRHPTGLLW